MHDCISAVRGILILESVWLGFVSEMQKLWSKRGAPILIVEAENTYMVPHRIELLPERSVIRLGPRVLACIEARSIFGSQNFLWPCKMTPDFHIVWYPAAPTKRGVWGRAQIHMIFIPPESRMLLTSP